MNFQWFRLFENSDFSRYSSSLNVERISSQAESLVVMTTSLRFSLPFLSSRSKYRCLSCLLSTMRPLTPGMSSVQSNFLD